MSRTADNFAQHLLSLARISPVPPVDVECLARRIDVLLRDNSTLVEDGRLEISGAHIEIHIRTGLSGPRRRFTVAHELGHLILPCPGTRMTAKRSTWDHSDEERLCDEIAAAILMPSQWVRRRFGHRVRNLSTIRHLAHQADVSMAAALVRLKELAGWTEVLLRWRHEEGRWRFVAGAGVPVSIFGEVRSADSTSHSLDKLRRSRGDTWTNLPLRLEGKAIEIPAQVSVVGGSAIALASLSPS